MKRIESVPKRPVILSPDERERVNEENRIRTQAARGNMSPYERERINEDHRIHTHNARDNMSPEERERVNEEVIYMLCVLPGPFKDQNGNIFILSYNVVGEVDEKVYFGRVQWDSFFLISHWTNSVN